MVKWKRRMQKNRGEKTLKWRYFFPLCMQIDRKIIAVIADSFSPKTERPWRIRVGEKKSIKLHSHPGPTWLAGYGSGQGHLPFLCLSFLKYWKRLFASLSYWEVEWDKCLRSTQNWQEKGAIRIPRTVVLLLLNCVSCWNESSYCKDA